MTNIANKSYEFPVLTNIVSFLIADLSSPVCLFCGSRFTAKVYLLDINKKEMRALDVDVSQPIRLLPD